jgi:hypothetical protein
MIRGIAIRKTSRPPQGRAHQLVAPLTSAADSIPLCCRIKMFRSMVDT